MQAHDPRPSESPARWQIYPVIRVADPGAVLPGRIRAADPRPTRIRAPTNRVATNPGPSESPPLTKSDPNSSIRPPGLPDSESPTRARPSRPSESPTPVDPGRQVGYVGGSGAGRAEAAHIRAAAARTLDRLGVPDELVPPLPPHPPPHHHHTHTTHSPTHPAPPPPTRPP